MSLNKVLRYIAIGGVFLLPFIPIYVSKTMFFPFITGKNFAFRILVEIVFASWLLLAIRVPQYRPKKTVLLWAGTIFVGIIIIADLFGVHVLKSIWSNFERMEGLLTLLHLFAYFVAAGAILNTERLWKRFWHVSIAVSLYLSIYGIFQLTGLKVINQGGARLDATFGNATYFAIYMVFHLFITALYFFRERAEAMAGKKWIKFGYIGLMALQFFTLYHTATRGALLGLVGGVFIAAVLIALFGHKGGLSKRLAIGSIAGVIVFIGVFALLKDTAIVKGSPVLERFASLSLKEGATRFRVWRMGLEGFKERPILGWGQGNFDIVFNKYYNPEMHTQEPWFDRAHNIVFDWLIAGGILGFLAYLSLFGTALYMLWKSHGESFSVTDKSLLTGLLVGYFFHNLFVFDNITSYIVFFSLLAFINSSASPVGSTDSEFNNQRVTTDANVSTLSSAMFPLVVIILIFSMYALNVKGIRASRQLIQAISPQDGGASKNLDYFRKASVSSPIGRIEVREQLIQFAVQAAASEQVEDNLKLEIVKTAESEMKNQLEAMPFSARHHFFLGSFYRRLGQIDQAIESFTSALELSQHKQQIIFELALSHLDKGDNEIALDLLKRAYDSAPDNSEAEILYALGAIYAGEMEISDELLLKRFGSTAPNDSRVLKAYFDVGNFDRVAAIWEGRVQSEPENAQFHLSLGAAYAQLGRIREALLEIDRAVELRPDYKEQAEEIKLKILGGGG
jgi:O-antigen ligase/tetratricopeptide (TPR) repeat protein